MDLTQFLQLTWNGLATGLIYALFGLAITLVYGLSRIVNFAVGEIMMVGAFVTWTVLDSGGGPVLALGAAVVATAALGLVTERTMFRYTLNAPFTGLAVSLGLTLFLQEMVSEIWGEDPHTAEPPISGAVTFADVVFLNQRILNTVLCVVVLVLFYVLLTQSSWGKQLRAVADNREAAALMGIPVQGVIASTFIVSSALCGVAGWIVLSNGAITAFVGSLYVLRGFAVALVGGLGNIKGAAVAGIGIGLGESYAGGYLDATATSAYVLAAVIVVLLIRPTGLSRGHAGAAIA